MKCGVLMTVAVAVAVFAVTVVALWPGNLRAGRHAKPLPAKIAQPVLEVNGCRATLRRLADTLKPGDKPELELEVTNPTDRPISLEFAVSMMSAAPTPPMSRMIRLPMPVWKHDSLITLEPGQARRVKLTAGKAVTAGHSVSFALRCGKRQVNLPPLTVSGGANVGPAGLGARLAPRSARPAR